MTQRTFGQLNQDRRNNFNFLRFFLALFVIVFHSFLLLPQGGFQDPVTRLTRGQMTGGSWAVQGFFIISGFLIAQRWGHNPKLMPFLRNRALRIYPGWIAALLVCTLVFAPLSGAALGVLLSKYATWLFFGQLLLHTGPSLPGVFATNPVPNIVNGSLWTIPLEILCYLGAALCGLWSLKFSGSRTLSGPQRSASLRWFVLLLFVADLLTVKLAPVGMLQNLPWFGDLEALPFYGMCFLSGMMIYVYRDVIPASWPLVVACMVVMVVTALRKQGMAIPFVLCGSYVLLFIAFLPISFSRYDLSRFGRRTDLSYGVYLYAYPIQQLITEFAGHRLTPASLFFAAIPPTFLLAAASWHFIEQPFLRLKNSPKIARSATRSEDSDVETALLSLSRKD